MFFCFLLKLKEFLKENVILIILLELFYLLVGVDFRNKVDRNDFLKVKIF